MKKLEEAGRKLHGEEVIVLAASQATVESGIPIGEVCCSVPTGNCMNPDWEMA